MRGRRQIGLALATVLAAAGGVFLVVTAWEAEPRTSAPRVRALQHEALGVADLARQGRVDEAGEGVAGLEARVLEEPNEGGEWGVRLEALRGVVSALATFLDDPASVDLAAVAASAPTPELRRSLVEISDAAEAARRMRPDDAALAPWRREVAAVVGQVEATWSLVVEAARLGERIDDVSVVGDVGVASSRLGEDLRRLAEQLDGFAPPDGAEGRVEQHRALQDAVVNLAHQVGGQRGGAAVRSFYDGVPVGETQAWRDIVAAHDRVLAAAAAVST